MSQHWPPRRRSSRRMIHPSVGVSKCESLFVNLKDQCYACSIIGSFCAAQMGAKQYAAYTALPLIPSLWKIETSFSAFEGKVQKLSNVRTVKRSVGSVVCWIRFANSRKCSSPQGRKVLDGDCMNDMNDCRSYVWCFVQEVNSLNIIVIVSIFLSDVVILVDVHTFTWFIRLDDWQNVYEGPVRWKDTPLYIWETFYRWKINFVISDVGSEQLCPTIA
jgi:hypothetical protein